MKRALPAHVYQKPNGLYFQRRGWKTVRINSEPGTKEFALEYAAILNGALVAPQTATGRTFAALIQSYHASPRYRGLAPRTARDYDKVLVWIKSKLGALDVSGMQRKDVIRARDANSETVRFANYIVQVLRILFEHAIDQGWREDNPAKGVSLLKSGAPPREAWPQDMIDAYRAKATGRALLIFELALGTGQRIGDVLKMRWSDIEGDGINVTQGKTGARLWVPFTARLRALLDGTPRIGLTICAWGPQGRALTYFPAAKAVRQVREAIGAEKYDIHGLRYAAAAELAMAGCSDELIASITGHKTSAMVAKYAGPARQKARAKAAQIKRGTEQE
ncbi:tyrosine-type recombinase/integrase [Gemmobacter sp. 24YEA27]|uniref:tyrosine-type recombinase/integrase n=1 Tax=Gemmobacter sp. 24YEA27 TaxID=3040672 RepID=UPI0024B33C72|nr:tyrosine-type recombinase/integrase [Gemmobacter sp. 24YEA27]